MTVIPLSRRSAISLEIALTAVALVAIGWFFFWTARTSGAFGTPGEEDYYNFLVRGWRGGHLYMSKEPRPEMLALADPYDPAQNSAVRLGDASFFRGHYYLYFSAAPALILHWPFHALTGHELATTSAIYVYCLTGFLAASAVWLLMRRRYFPHSAAWTGAAGVLMLGLGTGVLTLLRRPLVWELPISSAYAFAMLAVLAIYWALHGRRPVLAMGLAGLCVGLAVASRPGGLFGVAMLAPALWHLWRRPGAGTGGRWCAVAAAAGFGVCMIAVVAHNYARFGNPLEFGVSYELSSNYEAKERHFSLSYFAHNAWIYFFHPAQWSGQFPFIEATAVKGGPPGYLGTWVEAIGGLLVTFPILWFAATFSAVERYGGPHERANLRTMAATVAVWFVAGIGMLLGFYCATSRYLGDFAPALALLAVLGCLGLERRLNLSHWRRPLVTLVVVAGVITGVTGVLLSFDYHGRLLRTLQPQMWASFEKFFASAEPPPAALPPSAPGR
jgi:hypothetical protein